jgi:hypothetical protein
MQKLITVILAMLFISGLLNAQFTSFNLSDFKLPVIKRQYLDLNMNAYLRNSYYKNLSEGLPDYKSTVFDFQNRNLIVYGLYKNSEKVQREQLYRLDLEPSWSDRKTNTSKYSYSQFYSDLSVTSVNRMYFRDQFFFEPDLTISGGYTGSKDYTESTDQTLREIRKDISIEIPLLIGKGRIEQVQDARLALYILQDLQKAGRLVRIPEKTEILEFATYIAGLKNERYFDYRFRRMEEITMVDSFLQAKAWINKTDAPYYTKIYDNWEYAEGPVRLSGNRLAAGLVPLFGYNQYYSKNEAMDPDTEYDSRYTSGGIRFKADFISEKPVNIYWQRSWDAGVSSTFSKNWFLEKIVDDKHDYNLWYLTGELNYSLGYFPNSRTDITGKIGIQGSWSHSGYSDGYYISSAKGYVVYPYFSFNMHYYISAQVRLNVYYSGGYEYSNMDRVYVPDNSQYDKTNTYQENLNIGLVYSIF